MKTEPMNPAQRKLMLMRLCRVLGSPAQNVQVRNDRFEEMVNARVNLEFAANAMVMAGQAMNQPFIPPAGFDQEQTAAWLQGEQTKRLIDFRGALKHLSDVLALSLGHLEAGNHGVPTALPS